MAWKVARRWNGRYGLRVLDADVRRIGGHDMSCVKQPSIFHKTVVPKIDKRNFEESVVASGQDSFIAVPRCIGCPGDPPVYHIYHGCLPQLTKEDAKAMAKELQWEDYRIARWPSGEWVQ